MGQRLVRMCPHIGWWTIFKQQLLALNQQLSATEGAPDAPPAHQNQLSVSSRKLLLLALQLWLLLLFGLQSFGLWGAGAENQSPS